MKFIYQPINLLRTYRRASAGRLAGRGAALLAGLLLASCSGLKYIPEGQKLYTGSKVSIDAPTKLRNQAALQTELESVVRPKPNGAILGQRPKLYFWHLGVGKSKGLGHLLADKFGEAPVLLSQVQAKQTRDLMTNRLQNRGYFHGSVSSKVEEQEKTAQVNYTAHPGQQYLIQDIRFPLGDSLLEKAIRGTQAASLLKAGDPYDLDVFTNERVRIDLALKNQGFYYFNPNYLLFQVDSTLQGKANVYFKIKGETPARARRPYWLKTISLNTNYVLTDTTERNPVRFQKYLYYPDEEVFRARAITRAVFLYPDSLFRQKRRDQTLSRLMSLGTFRFVEIKFRPSAAGDSAGRARLDSDILMTQLKKKSLRAELQLVSKSNGFTGPGLTIQYRNRSALRGAEQLLINAVASTETQTKAPANAESRSNTGLISNEFGINAQLIVPRLIAPHLPFLNPRLVNSDFQPRTNFGAGIRYVTRTGYFATTSYSANYGYSWKTKITNEQELKLIDVSYNAVSTDTAFDRVLRLRPFLKQAYQAQFILASSYRYTYNQQVLENRRQQIFFQGMAEVSGNIANAISSAVVGQKSPTEYYTIAGQRFAQYAKFDLELREYYRISANPTSGNRIVGRLQIGVGLPYGNSAGGTLPYLRQYGIGGPNSIRAYAARQIGPGSYKPVATDIVSNYYDQVGDLRLEGNIEYRQDLFPYVKGAVFLDAGNIWLVNNDPQRPGGQFQASTFLQQLAVGTGVGLRIDVQFFVIRFDYAIPLRANYGTPDDKTGRLNLAIGYPF
ncbi:translocation and assembly module lipoprotein TamL [Hymenobacter cheonanensis]|uniref:translocation and assembly module lipoprotein TamL n=1 Tax=Hymenobacter sp. CA2-7 TaxID=3063993 RepID=UPI002713F8FF|nr:BamA/TamA family outer membrane protein [Hymenobacter sp. CA2-7]MDO7885794.1 BamA/TamA family outer membrane protein [Hymenobacter sp. CA2-7]